MIDLTYYIGYLIGLIFWYRVEIIVGLSAGVLVGISVLLSIHFSKYD